LHWPKITLVTPSYNQAAWIEQTLTSVLSQGYPNLQYGIVDGVSTDGSVEIIERYRSQLAFIISEPDKGMYDAIQKGFARGDGEIMGWLNSDDILMPKALFTLGRLFTDITEAEWITGYQCVIDEQGSAVALAPPRAWSAEGFALNPRWIQQESTFWKRSLWDRAGASLKTSLKLAGDFELWHRFFQYAPLYSTDALIGGFRARTSGQASLNQMDVYEAEMDQVRREQPYSSEITNRIASIKNRELLLSSLKGIGKDAIRSRWITPLMPAPPRIRFHQIEQSFYLAK
jgi:glycosyltransferase involved in cell wall biosynthesis